MLHLLGRLLEALGWLWAYAGVGMWIYSGARGLLKIVHWCERHRCRYCHRVWRHAPDRGPCRYCRAILLDWLEDAGS